MSSPTTHRVVTGADGHPVLVKRATDPEAAARLTGEATVLRTLAHPGTVTVVAHRSDDAGAELHLAWVGPHTLATVTGLPLATAGDLVAQVAATVADLHRAGIVHRRLTPDHVLLAPAGRAVLTGFADAVRVGPTADPAADVADLGALLTRLVAPLDGGPVIPETRRARAGDGGRRAALLTLADRAQSDDPATRPTASDLAASLRTTIDPPPRRPRRSEPVIRSSGKPFDLITGSGRGRGRAWAGVALGVAVLTTIGAAAWLGSPEEVSPEGAALPTTSTVPPTTTTSSTTTTSPSTTAPTTTAPCPPVQGTAADVDGDGCAEAVSIDGERVTVGRTTWRAGRPGDLVVVGDWDCDGQATIASLRASTGEVFVFDRWARALTVAATTQVDGATGLQAVDADGDGCADLVAQRTGGEAVTVEVAA